MLAALADCARIVRRFVRREWDKIEIQRRGDLSPTSPRSCRQSELLILHESLAIKLGVGYISGSRRGRIGGGVTILCQSGGDPGLWAPLQERAGEVPIRMTVGRVVLPK